MKSKYLRSTRWVGLIFSLPPSSKLLPMAMEARKVASKEKAAEVVGMAVDHAEGDMEVEVPDVNTVEAEEVVEDVQAEAVEVSVTDQADRTHTILVDDILERIANGKWRKDNSVIARSFLTTKQSHK